MKNKAFKEILKYVRVIVFFAVITILVEAINYVMVQPGYARYIIHTVDNPDEGSDYDCIVVGASHGRASIDPHYFLEMGYAVNPVNMCIQGATVCFIGTIYAAAGIEKYRSWRENTIFKDEVGAVHMGLRTLINVYFRVQLIIMSINIVVCSTAFLMIGNPYAILLGVLTGIIDALPIFGTGTVLIPWAVGSLLFGHVKNAVILVVLYIVTYFVREIMESKCMGDRMGIAPFTMLAVIYIGILVYGVVGFILGPISYCIIKALVLYLKSILEHDKL